MQKSDENVTLMVEQLQRITSKPLEANLAISIGAAFVTLGELVAQSRRAGALLAAAEARFHAQDRGVERPAQVLRSVHDAREDTRRRKEDTENKMHKSHAPYITPLPAEYYSAPRDLYNFVNNEPVKNNRTIEQWSGIIAREWLTVDFLGPTIYGRFSRTPPIQTVEESSFFDAYKEAFGILPAGLQFPRTNHQILDISKETDTPANKAKTVVHEELHYASELGGGKNIRWWDDTLFRPRELGHVSWLHEGLTELYAQQLTRAHGLTPDYVSYPYETATAFYLQKLVGEETLKRAYLTGDFTYVRNTVDAKLGSGTFERLVGSGNVIKEGARGVESLDHILEWMDSVGVDHKEWDKDFIVAEVAFASSVAKRLKVGP